MDKPGGKKRRLDSEGDLESGSINLRKVLNDRVENVGVRAAPLRPPNEERPSLGGRLLAYTNFYGTIVGIMKR